ncbi:hypothetical protein B224_p00018 (plasmid) [Aeromonas media WS]|nr:hypothetical protein B224_p00018 [Aeromonas media WS]
MGELSGWVFSLVKMPIEHNGHYAQWFDRRGDAFLFVT